MNNEERKRALRTQGRYAGGLTGGPSRGIGRGGPRRSTGTIETTSQTQLEQSNKAGPQTLNSSMPLSYKRTEVVPISPIIECKTFTLQQYNNWIELDPMAEPPSVVYYKPNILSTLESHELFDILLKGGDIKWEEMSFKTDSGQIIVPRMVCWYGPFGYVYSNKKHEANMQWPTVITELKDRVEALLASMNRPITFNSVLLNLYRTGKDGVGWHSDDEMSMGVKPTIASISLGETRKFELKRKGAIDEKPEWTIHLNSGSLLVMDGNVQIDWKHRVPREYHDRSPRINLTFRTVHEVPAKNPRRTI